MLLATKASSVFIVMVFMACPHTASSIHVRNATNLPDPNGSLAQLQYQSRVAIVIRGHAFRSSGRFGAACKKGRISDQLRITQSLMDKVVLPLEQASHTVDMYLAESSNCSLLGHITSILGESRVRVQQSFLSQSQKDSVRGALDLYNRYRAGHYDVVILSRFDLWFRSSIKKWPTVNFRKFNFFSLCEPIKHVVAPSRCVNDVLYIMPGKYVTGFRMMVGHGLCFRVDGDRETVADMGHWCYNQVAEMFGRNNVGFVTDWKPRHKVREQNPVANLF